MQILKIFLFVVFCLGTTKIFAQPYTLDKNLKPIKIELKEVEENEGEKFISFFNRMDSITMLHTVHGHNMFQFVDVLVTSIAGEPLEVSLVNNNWNDVIEHKNTKSAKDGIVNFKLRSYGAFGIKVEADSDSNIGKLYNITVTASKPNKTYMGSPFREAKKSELKAKNSDKSDSESAEDNSLGSTLLYVILGIGIIIIGLLLAIIFKNKKGAVIIIFFSLSSAGFAQSQGVFLTKEEFNSFKTEIEGDFNSYKNANENYLKNIQDKIKILEAERKAVDKSVKDLNKTLSDIRKVWGNAKSAWDLYHGMGACISSGPDMSEPTVPSICTSYETEFYGDDVEVLEVENEDCAQCYIEAREKFNRVRYLLEELATIYRCTKDFSNAALSFGDNASGVHGVVGLAWQNERRGIEKSIKNLETAYDNKYAQLMQELASAMEELNVCEAQYGLEDWYDRFGFVYFEFMKDKYKR